MKTNITYLKRIAAIGSFALVIGTTPLFAQTTGQRQSDAVMSQADQSEQRIDEAAGAATDDAAKWGWLGLVGLAGLFGLKRNREAYDDRTRTARA